MPSRVDQFDRKNSERTNPIPDFVRTTRIPSVESRVPVSEADSRLRHTARYLEVSPEDRYSHARPPSPVGRSSLSPVAPEPRSPLQRTTSHTANIAAMQESKQIIDAMQTLKEQTETEKRLFKTSNATTMRRWWCK